MSTKDKISDSVCGTRYLIKNFHLVFVGLTSGYLSYGCLQMLFLLSSYETCFIRVQTSTVYDSSKLYLSLVNIIIIIIIIIIIMGRACNQNGGR
jgi:hypothetical protein